MNGNCFLIGLILLVIGMLGFVPPIVKAISFNVGCGGYLKSAADAPTVEMARTELDTAIEYIDNHGLTYGHSHLIIPNRQADVGYWSDRIKSARIDLDTITEESTGLEKSNMLMKLRETLLDEGESGTEVTTPPHISVFPAQWLWTIACLFGVIFGLLGIILMAGSFAV